MRDDDTAVGYELLASTVGLEVEVLGTTTRPTTDDDLAVEIELRIDEDDVEPFAIGILFVLGVLSFSEARPAGVSEIDFHEKDDFSVADLVRCLSFRRGELRFDADYLRGRRMKTEVVVRGDGRITVRTRGRDPSAQRWLLKLQAKRPLSLVTEPPPE